MQIISRTVAARFFATRLRPFTDRQTLVLASSRNAVPLACALGREIECPVDVVLFCELRLPDRPGRTLGAVDEAGEVVWMEEESGPVSQEELAGCLVNDLEALLARRHRWTPRHGSPELAGKTVIIVAEGVASGAQLREAMGVVRRHQPAHLYGVVASATPEALRRIRGACDGLACLDVAESYSQVARSLIGAEPVTEDRAIEMLRESTGWGFETKEEAGF